MGWREKEDRESNKCNACLRRGRGGREASKILEECECRRRVREGAGGNERCVI